MNTQKLFINYP